MFCKNCGKDIGDAKFCQYCGYSNDINPNTTANPNQNNLFTTIKDGINQIGYNKLIDFLSMISAIISIAIRIINNEIEVIYYFLAQDDYFVISESGRKYIIIVIALQTIITLFYFLCTKKEQIKNPTQTIVLFIVSLVIQILAMMLRIPAPY